MVGSGGAERSKEAVGMMALHEALRSVCLNSDWTYSVFWTIRPRPRVRGGNGCKVGDDNGSLMLMWEDGFCRGRIGESLDEIDSEDPVKKAFSKMSIQLYNYGEGLMGKVASDKCHKWVFKEPTECEPNISNYWQSSFDALPPEWTDQFESGIQTIAVIQAGHGLLQLGSCKIIPEDLHFVLRMRHTFESLGYQSGFYLSQIFSSNRNASAAAVSFPSKQPMPTIRPPPSPPPHIFNWDQRPLPSLTSLLPLSPNFQRPLGFPHGKDETHMFLMPHSSSDTTGVVPPEEAMPVEHEADLKWPNGLTFFNALTGGRTTDETRLLFNPENMENNFEHGPNHPLILDGKPSSQSANDMLSLDTHPHPHPHHHPDNKYKRRSFTMPEARVASSSSSTSLDHHHRTQNSTGGGEYRNDAPLYSDVMETFLE